MSGVRCPSCSGPYLEKVASLPVICARCGTAFYCDEFGSYIPLVAACRLNEQEATARIMEWASGVKGGREFSKNIELAKMTRKYYPVFVYGRARNGERSGVVGSAVAVAEPGVRNIEMDGVDAQPLLVTAADQSELIKPTLGPSAYRQLLSIDPSTRTMCYYPFWCTQYVYHGRLNTVTVDGYSGRVSGDLSVEIERKSGMPLAAAAFVALGLEGALAYVSWMLALAAVIVTAGFTVHIARRKKEELS